MEDGDLTYQVIGAAMAVHQELGRGLLEKPYENALAIELDERGIAFEQQPSYSIVYHGKPVGFCVPDFVIGNEVVVDCKSVKTIGDNEIAQMLNYLRIAKKAVGLVINFRGKSLEFRRVVDPP